MMGKGGTMSYDEDYDDQMSGPKALMLMLAMGILLIGTVIVMWSL